MSNYANLQLLLDEHVEAARERIIYVITAYMDAQGMMPCGHESAERTVAFAPSDSGWAIFDDCADRLNIHALDGLGCCLTGKLRTRAIGVMCSNGGRMLRLYNDGYMRDTYITSPKAFGKAPGKAGCHGHALRWRIMLRETGSLKDLSAAFLHGQQDPDRGFEELKRLLMLGDTSTYGFCSLEDAELPGVITLHYCAANHIRQHWFDRLVKPAHTARTITGAFFRHSRCNPWQ